MRTVVMVSMVAATYTRTTLAAILTRTRYNMLRSVQDLVANGLGFIRADKIHRTNSEIFPTSPTTVVPLHQRSDIECLPDVISVYLPKSLLPEERNITWREDACDLTFNGTHYVSTISLSECGTTVSIDNTTVTFTNELVVHKMAADNSARDADDVIIFGSSYETVIPVQCVYPRFNNVSSAYIPVKQNIRFFEKRFGELDISMDQFDSEAFSRPLSLDGAPRKVPLDEDLFIRVGLSNRPTEVRVRADQCIATASSNPADRNWRQLIDEGCAVNGVRLLSNDSDGDVKFALKAFDFRHNASGFVFLHCQVSVCGVADDSCRMGCLTRSRRAVNGGKSSHLVSTGPFYVERKEEEAQKQIVTMPTVFATVCLLVAMVAVVVAVVGWTRRRHENQKDVTNCKTPETKTTQTRPVLLLYRAKHSTVNWRFKA